MQEIESIFSGLGAIFCTPSYEIAQRLKQVKAFVFDWDGVFNNAIKNADKSSYFNEVDSMGTNMLRFSYYLNQNHLPNTAIISGERNEMAFYFANREHFQAGYYKVADKMIALKHFCEQKGIQPHEVCYFYDDVLDLSIASVAGIRIMINRKANPLFRQYVVKSGLADYITASESGNFAIREACEMLMGLLGNYDACIDERKEFSEKYKTYLNQRQSVQTEFYTVQNDQIIMGS